MKTDYKPIKPMKEIPDQLRKLRRQFLRYQQAEIVYSLSHKKLLELASDAGAIYRFDSTVLINREIFDAYLERFHLCFCFSYAARASRRSKARMDSFFSSPVSRYS